MSFFSISIKPPLMLWRLQKRIQRSTEEKKTGRKFAKTDVAPKDT